MDHGLWTIDRLIKYPVKKIYTLFYKNLFLTNRFFTGLGCCVVLFMFAFFFPWLGIIPQLVFYTLLLLTFIDIYLLYRTHKGVFAKRHAPERLSNSDDNELGIYVENWYPFNVSIGIIDEIPFQ